MDAGEVLAEQIGGLRIWPAGKPGRPGAGSPGHRDSGRPPARLFVLLDEHILPEADRTVGRPGMDLWQILVLGVLKQGLGCDFDRLHDLTNHHQTIRAFLGHGDFDDKTRYEYQTVVDNGVLVDAGAVIGGRAAGGGERTQGSKKSLASITRAV